MTRDRGREVLLVKEVPAGLTALQALDREAEVETRYGGRFVHSVEGIAGSLSKRQDWFYFVNGIELDRSAGDYELQDGDIAWWDFRSWRGRMREPVVVGAFPEPFLHGFEGKVRPVAVRYERDRRAGATAIGKLLRATSVRPRSIAAPSGANVFVVSTGPLRFTARLRDPNGEPGSPVEFFYSGDAAALARNPSRYRYRYEVRP